MNARGCGQLRGSRRQGRGPCARPPRLPASRVATGAEWFAVVPAARAGCGPRRPPPRQWRRLPTKAAHESDGTGTGAAPLTRPPLPPPCSSRRSRSSSRMARAARVLAALACVLVLSAAGAAAVSSGGGGGAVRQAPPPSPPSLTPPHAHTRSLVRSKTVWPWVKTARRTTTAARTRAPATTALATCERGGAEGGGRGARAAFALLGACLPALAEAPPLPRGGCPLQPVQRSRRVVQRGRRLLPRELQRRGHMRRVRPAAACVRARACVLACVRPRELPQPTTVQHACAARHVLTASVRPCLPPHALAARA